MPSKKHLMISFDIIAIAMLSSLPLIANEVGTTAFRNNMHGARYGEIVVVTGGPLTFTGHVYNTLGLNDCPEAAWKALHPQQLKEQFKADAIILNGPRYFLMDSVSLANPGSIATFGGLQARHLADVKIPLSSVLRGRSKPYTENVVTRTTQYVYRKGNTVYELISPDGRVYVMQAYALIVDPTLTEAKLAGLGSKLKLPQGWQYHVRKLDSDLVLRTSGVAYVLQDELQNSYQRSNLTTQEALK